MAYGEKKRAERLRAMKAGKLPVREAMRNHDWDSLIAKAEEHLKDAKGAERKLPPLWQIAKKCGLQQDYLGYYSLFSEATHSGHIELGGYMKLNAEGTGVGTLLYGLEDGDWVDWVALEGAGFLIDCMELSAHIFEYGLPATLNSCSSLSYEKVMILRNASGRFSSLAIWRRGRCGENIGE